MHFAVNRSPAAVEAAARGAALCHPARSGHRAAFHKSAAEGASQGHIRLRRLRTAAVLLDDQVRERHGLAELLEAAAARGRRAGRPQPADGAHRNPVLALRRPPRPCVQRRAEADRPALLHERTGAGFRAVLIVWLNARRERRLFQAVVLLAAVVPISAGAVGALQGPHMMRGFDGPIDLDSHFRYLSGLLLGSVSRFSGRSDASIVASSSFERCASLSSSVDWRG